MAKYVYPAVFTKEDNGQYYVNFPDVGNCFTGGDNLAEVLDMAQDALCLMLYDLEENHKEIPKPSNRNDIILESNEFVNLIWCDTEFYKRYYENKSGLQYDNSERVKLIYPACFYPDDVDKNSFTVVFPDLQGAVTEGKTLLDTIEMATDCACGWILSTIEDGKSIPKPTPLSEVHADDYENGFVNLIILDIDDYVEKYLE